MSEDNDDSTTFLRQRRDLFAISALLLLIPIADIKVASTVAIQQFGMSMNIGKPEVIAYGLWILWAYWYLRYFQAYSALNKNHLIDAYSSEISRYLYPLAKEKAEKLRDKLVTDNKFNDGSNVGYDFKKQEYYLFRSEYTCGYSQYDASSSSPINIAEVIFIKGFKYHLIQIKSLIKCCLKRIDITEYLLPFAFGLAPLVYLIVTKISP